MNINYHIIDVNFISLEAWAAIMGYKNEESRSKLYNQKLLGLKVTHVMNTKIKWLKMFSTQEKEKKIIIFTSNFHFNSYTQ